MHDLFAGQDSCIKAAAVPPRTLAAPCAIRARGCGIPTCAGKWPLDAQYDLPLDPLSMSRPEFASARFGSTCSDGPMRTACPKRPDIRFLFSNRNERSLWWRTPLERKAAARFVIGGISSEEIDLHALKFFRAIACERLDAFVINTPLMLFAEERAKFRVCGEKLGPVSCLNFKASSVFAEHLVEKTDIARRPRPDWLTGLR